MSIDPNLLIAAKMIHDECAKYGNCDCCKIKFACSFSEIPSLWEIPDPPPEPTERQRIEWLRMLPDGEMAKAMDNMQNGYCSSCEYCLECSCDVDSPCNKGHMDWWHEVVSLEQFRKDVELND